jgi:hypothetical protein
MAAIAGPRGGEIIMVNQKLTMMKKSLTLRFPSQCQADRMACRWYKKAWPAAAAMVPARVARPVQGGRLGPRQLA